MRTLGAAMSGAVLALLLVMAASYGMARAASNAIPSAELKASLAAWPLSGPIAALLHLPSGRITLTGTSNSEDTGPLKLGGTVEGRQSSPLFLLIPTVALLLGGMLTGRLAGSRLPLPIILGLWYGAGITLFAGFAPLEAAGPVGDTQVTLALAPDPVSTFALATLWGCLFGCTGIMLAAPKPSSAVGQGLVWGATAAVAWGLIATLAGAAHSRGIMENADWKALSNTAGQVGMGIATASLVATASNLAPVYMVGVPARGEIRFVAPEPSTTTVWTGIWDAFKMESTSSDTMPPVKFPPHGPWRYSGLALVVLAVGAGFLVGRGCGQAGGALAGIVMAASLLLWSAVLAAKTAGTISIPGPIEGMALDLQFDVTFRPQFQELLYAMGAVLVMSDVGSRLGKAALRQEDGGTGSKRQG